MKQVIYPLSPGEGQSEEFCRADLGVRPDNYFPDEPQKNILRVLRASAVKYLFYLFSSFSSPPRGLGEHAVCLGRLGFLEVWLIP